jgi:DNA polymerase-3 subunit beta
MRLVCTKENFARGLSAVARAVSSRGPLPILTHVKLVADGDGVRFTATDLEVGLEARVPADVSEPGSVAITAKTLSEIVSKLPSADIELVTPDHDAEVTLRCLRSKFTLRGLPAAEFPQLPQPSGAGASVRLGAEELLKGIRQTLFAAAGEDKAVISGLFVKLEAGKLELVATDGYRLACRETSLGEQVGALSVVVPKRAMDELARQLGAMGTGEVEISVGANQIGFTLGERYMTSRLVDGQYPNYRQIIPTNFEREAIIDRAAFLAAVERVSIMAFDREAHTIKLEFATLEVTLSAGNSELGDSDETVATEYTGEPLAISFNADFLVDALKHMDAETVRIGLNTALSPVLIRPLGDDGHTCLLMPVNRV